MCKSNTEVQTGPCWECGQEFCGDCHEKCYNYECNSYGCVQHVFSCPKCGNIACPKHSGKYPNWYNVCADCLNVQPTTSTVTNQTEIEDD